MARIDLYLDDEEFAFVKRHGKGFVRGLVRQLMDDAEKYVIHDVFTTEKALPSDRWTRRTIKSPEQYRREKEDK